jgi:hypothetical protein
MKPTPSRSALHRAILPLAVGFIACALSGCAHPAAQAVAGPVIINDQQAMAALLNGSATLDCGHECAAVWAAARPKALARLNARDWHGLAVLVLQTRYQQDLGYYYLGRAAEELGAGKAAQHYYQTAFALTEGKAPELRCSASPGGCDGANLPTEEALHIELTRAAALGPRPAASRPPGAAPSVAPSAAPAATPPAAGPGDTGWVDPPPAGQ